MTDNKPISKDNNMIAIAKTNQAFYVDFMPMIQKIQYDVSVLNCFSDEKSKKHYMDDINEQLDKAMALLKQIKKLQMEYWKKMIDYIKDMFVIGSKITTFPYTLKGPIAIASKNGKHIRCPAWGWDKTIIKFDENYIYMKSDIAGKIDVFDAEGAKVKEISEEELK